MARPSGATEKPIDPSLAAGLALAALLVAVGVGGIASLAAAIFGLRTLDERLVAVCFAAALALLGFRGARPGTSRWARAICVLIALPMLGAPALPHSALTVSWLTSVVLVMGLDAVVYAVRAAARMNMHIVLRVLAALFAAAFGLYLWSATFIVLFNTQLVIVPRRLVQRTPTRARGERVLSLVTDDGLVLGATYTPGDEGAPGIVLAHGVSDWRERFAPWAERLGALGYHVIRFDFRAHGTSDGAVCTYGQREAADVRAAVRTLRALPEVDGNRIALVAASMGGSAALAAAPTLHGLRGMVLLAPASRYAPLVARRTAWLGPFAPFVLRGSAQIAHAIGQAPMSTWAPADRLRSVRSLPILVVHGAADRTIPIEQSQRLVREHRAAELMPLPGVAHDELVHHVVEDHEVWARVRDFLGRVLMRGND
jgi:alpha-beta hydrolase superfamily lysophospholipase